VHQAGGSALGSAITAATRSVRYGMSRNSVTASPRASPPRFSSPRSLPYPEAVFDMNYFPTNPWPFYRLAKELWPGNFAPTAAHHFVALLHDRGQLLRCYTQNIDSLEAAAGLPPEKVIAAHGNFDSAHVAGRPAEAVPIGDLKAALLEGEDSVAALNERYGGLVKPAITFFGEALPRRFAAMAPDDFDACDLLLVMGTSLKVQPFASLVGFPNVGTPRLLINRERVGPFATLPDPTDGGAEVAAASAASGGGVSVGSGVDVFFQGDCDAGVAQLALLAGFGGELDARIYGFRR